MLYFIQFKLNSLKLKVYLVIKNITIISELHLKNLHNCKYYGPDQQWTTDTPCSSYASVENKRKHKLITSGSWPTCRIFPAI